METEVDYERIEELEGERRTWEQVLRQTEGDLTAYGEGWQDSAAYAEVGRLRDTCREEIWAIDVQIAEERGEEPPERPVRVAPPAPERIADTEDGLAELSEVSSETAITAQDNADAIADLSELVSELMGGGDE